MKAKSKPQISVEDLRDVVVSNHAEVVNNQAKADKRFDSIDARLAEILLILKANKVNKQ